MLRFVLCDDNLQIVNKLSCILESIFAKHNVDAKICLKATTSNEVLQYLENNKVDVLIQDINLKSTLSGCDLADIVRKKNKSTYIIFLTAHFEYALVAYKYKTFDYLVKPISQERLEETMLRLMEDITSNHSNFLKINNTVINEDNINFIKKDGMKLVFCTSTDNYETYSSLAHIQSCLPDNFVRCHKSFIININNVAQFVSATNVIQFTDKHICSVGAKYKTKMMEVLNYELYSNCLECVNR